MPFEKRGRNASPWLEAPGGYVIPNNASPAKVLPVYSPNSAPQKWHGSDFNVRSKTTFPNSKNKKFGKKRGGGSHQPTQNFEVMMPVTEYLKPRGASPKSSPMPKVKPNSPFKGKSVRFESRPDSIGAQAASYSGSSATNVNELVYEYTDFFDWDVTGTDPKKPIKLVSFDPHQGFFSADGDVSDSGDTLARLLRVDAWVLPRAENAATETTAFVAIAGVAGVPTGYATQEPILTAVQNTVVKPNFNIDWVKILSYNANKIYGDGLFAPLVHGDGTAVEAFRMCCVDPDSGAPLSSHKIQVRYKVRLAITLPAAASRKVGVENVIGWVSKGTNSTTNDFILPNVVGLLDTSH